MAVSARQRKQLYLIILNEVFWLGTSLPCDVGGEVGRKVTERLPVDQSARLGLATSSRVVTGWLAEPLSSNWPESSHACMLDARVTEFEVVITTASSLCALFSFANTVSAAVVMTVWVPSL